MSVDTELYQTSQLPSSKSGIKKPLFSLEAEQAVLGGLMLDGRAWERIAGHVVAVDFYVPAHGNVFEDNSGAGRQATAYRCANCY